MASSTLSGVHAAPRKCPTTTTTTLSHLVDATQRALPFYTTLRDGSGTDSGQISTGFRSSGFGLGFGFFPMVFGFRDPKLIRFGFHPLMPNGGPK
jgi:hypothetical protein